MELKARFTSAERALGTLDEILAEPFSVVVRDASIQRFEYTFEAVWKLLKAFLQEQEGLVCNSPKTCFRSAAQIGLLDAQGAVQCLKMTDDRNLTAHMYLEEIARDIFGRLDAHRGAMRDLVYAMRARMGEQAPGQRGAGAGED